MIEIKVEPIYEWEKLSGELRSLPAKTYMLRSFTFIERVYLKIFIWRQYYLNLREKYNKQYQNYFRWKDVYAQEKNMVNAQFIRFLVNDIVDTEEYTLEGIANHLREPFEIIYDLAAGINTTPSLDISTKIIELHSVLKNSLYYELIKKLLDS